jgi:hypothetical protein
MACPEYLLEREGSANRQDHYNSTSARENEVTCKASFILHPVQRKEFGPGCQGLSSTRVLRRDRTS